MLEKKPATRQRGFIAEWAVTIILLLFGTTTLAQAFVIPTGSMEDSLLVGDHVLVDKLAYSPADPVSRYLLPYQEPKHGDIIVFRYPPDVKQTLVKRLIGAPGDHLRLTSGVLFRNGVRLNESYAYHKYFYNPGEDNFPGECCRPVKEPAAQEAQRQMLKENVLSGEVVVPENMYFAMGDNRENSSDSRYWGFVPRQNIFGKPILIYWSYDASTGDLMGSNISHVIDLSEHFFSKTRWERTLKFIR